MLCKLSAIYKGAILEVYSFFLLFSIQKYSLFKNIDYEIDKDYLTFLQSDK